MLKYNCSVSPFLVKKWQILTSLRAQNKEWDQENVLLLTEIEGTAKKVQKKS